MKKIKLTVAALLLGGMSYAQCTSTTDLFCSCDSLSVQQISNIAYIESVNTIEDMVEWMHQDIQNEVIDKDYGEMYVQNMIDLLSKLEDINAMINPLDCENCDEID